MSINSKMEKLSFIHIHLTLEQCGEGLRCQPPHSGKFAHLLLTLPKLTTRSVCGGLTPGPPPTPKCTAPVPRMKWCRPPYPRTPDSTDIYWKTLQRRGPVQFRPVLSQGHLRHATLWINLKTLRWKKTYEKVHAAFLRHSRAGTSRENPEHPGFAGGGRELGLTGGRGLSAGMMADLDKDICVLSKLRVFT